MKKLAPLTRLNNIGRTIRCWLLVQVSLTIFLSSLLLGQTPQIIRAQGVGQVIISDFMTLDQARRKAKEMARENAISQTAGIHLQTEQFFFQFETADNDLGTAKFGESFAQYIRESQRGTIVREHHWEFLDSTLHANGNTQFLTIARNEFEVQIMEQQRDPEFTLSASLSKPVYLEGETLSLVITARKDCFLHIFNLAANDTLYMLYPNILDKQTRLPANTPRVIPNERYQLIASLPAQKQREVEHLFVIATRDSLVFDGMLKNEISTGGYAQMWKTGLNDILQWLANIDPARRAEWGKSFEIVRNNERPRAMQ